MVGSLLSGCIVPLYLDSQVAVMNLAGDIPQYPGNVFGGSKKEEIQDLVIHIFNLTEQHNFGIHPIHENRMREPISTLISTNTTTMTSDLNQKYFFHRLDIQYGPHTIDRSASDQHNFHIIIRNFIPKMLRVYMCSCLTGDMIITIMFSHPKP